MKIMIIISLLLSSLFAQNYTKKDFANKSIERGWNYETCAFGTSGDHINGPHAAKSLSTERAVKNIVINNCSKTTKTISKNGDTILRTTTVSSSAELGYKIILQGKIQGKHVSAVCATKPIVCTNH